MQLRQAAENDCSRHLSRIVRSVLKEVSLLQSGRVPICNLVEKRKINIYLQILSLEYLLI